MSEGFQSGGWLYEREDFAYLADCETGKWRDAVFGRFSAPEELDRRWLRTENQAQQGSCQGHALTDVGEVCYHIATRGQVIQFSRQFAYIRSQIHDGGARGDVGSTLSSGAKVATTEGFCPEELWPYTGKYVTKPSGRTMEECLAAAAAFKLKTVERLRSYDDIFNWLAGGVGIPWIGIQWGSGGHSVSLPGYSKRKDKKGRNFLWMHNSWGTSWEHNGWKEIDPATVDAWFKHPYTVVLGGSDMVGDGIKPRPVDWVKESYHV